METCPPIRSLAAFAESPGSHPELARHVEGCRACSASLTALSDEVRSLQISISELWFRERISCPPQEVLDRWPQGLEEDLRGYVAFHVDDLGCPYCQAALGQRDVEADRDETGRRERSRKRVGEATSVLLRDLRRQARS